MKRRRNESKRADQILDAELLDAVHGGGNDAIGTRDYAIDEITGASPIRGRKKRRSV